jgi:mycothiol synthase
MLSENLTRIRDFRTDDYPAVVAIGNVVWPDMQVTPHDLAARDRRLAGRVSRRQVAEVGGQVVGFSLVENDWHDPDPQHFRVNGAVVPAWQGRGVGAALWADVERWLAERATGVVAEVREHHPAGRHLLESRGFRPAMRWAASRLVVDRFNAARFAHRVAQVEASGVRIESFAELRQRDPAAIERLHALRWTIDAELPGLVPRVPESIEAFAAYFERNPSALPEGWLVAHAEGRYLGLSSHWASRADLTCLHTGFTGVLPDVRRRGIATALKVAGVALARRRGCQFIDTDNEADGAMHRLNLGLGFEPESAWLVYRRD